MMKSWFGWRKSTKKTDPPSLESSSVSDVSSNCGDSEAAVLTPIRMSLSTPTKSRMRTSPQNVVAAATAAAAAASSPTSSPKSAAAATPPSSRKKFPLTTPTRKKGYSAFSELKAGQRQRSNESLREATAITRSGNSSTALVTTTTNSSYKKSTSKSTNISSNSMGRFGVIRLVRRITTRSFGAASDTIPYAPPPPDLMAAITTASSSSVSPSLATARSTSPTAELWKKLFGPNVEQHLQLQLPESPSTYGSKLTRQSKRQSRSSRSNKAVKVTVEDGVNNNIAQLIRPPPQPAVQPLARRKLRQFQQQQKQRNQLLQQLQLEQQQDQKKPIQQARQRLSPKGANNKGGDQRRVHYRDEVSEISARDFGASFLYDDHDNSRGAQRHDSNEYSSSIAGGSGMEDDFNDEASRSVGTGTSSAASCVSEKTGTTSDSLFTDLSGYTSTMSDPTRVYDDDDDDDDDDSSSLINPRSPPRGFSFATRFGHLRCGGDMNDVDDNISSQQPRQQQQQGLAESLLDDFRSVMIELVRDVFCLPSSQRYRKT